MPPHSKETKIGKDNQEAFQSTGKNAEVVLVPCCAWTCVPVAISDGVDISEFPGFYLLRQMRVTKILSEGHKNYIED